MQEYSIHRSTRRCQKSDRLFAPGEGYFSVVLQKGSELVRWDIARDQWNGPPEGAIGWWTAKIPTKTPGKLTPAPAAVLLDTLQALCEDPTKSELAYLLALLLVRRRILVPIDDSFESNSENLDAQSILHLTHTPSNRDFVIPVCQPSTERSEELQQELSKLLFCEV